MIVVVCVKNVAVLVEGQGSLIGSGGCFSGLFRVSIWWVCGFRFLFFWTSLGFMENDYLLGKDLAYVSAEFALSGIDEGQLDRRDLTGKMDRFWPEPTVLQGKSITFNPESQDRPVVAAVETLRWISRDRQSRVTLSPPAPDVDGAHVYGLALETTAYRNYDDFVCKIQYLLDTVRAGREIMVEGVVLRYLNEIRPVNPTDSDIDWEKWVTPRLANLLNGVNLGNAESEFLSTINFPVQRDCHMHLRFGPRYGHEFLGDESFKRKLHAPSPYFLLDIIGEQRLDAVDPSEALGVIPSLHRSIEELFHWSIDPILKKGM